MRGLFFNDEIIYIAYMVFVPNELKKEGIA